MNSVKVVAHTKRWLSSSSSSSSKSSSKSIPWISPLQYPKTTPKKPDPPTTTTITEAPKKTKFISHESAICSIKREKDPQRALEIFNKVSNQRGFNHNNSTYAVILHKLASSKKFEAVDALLHQMTYETCKFHEGVFLNLMAHYSQSLLHERVLDMFSLIQLIVREKPSLKAISTCLNLLIDSDQIDLARTLLLNTKKNLSLEPNTCIFNILVKYHCKNGDLDSAFEVVKEMKKSTVSYPNLITYSTLMGGLCVRGRLQDALQLFEEMLAKDQIIPDALTYNVLITGFCRGGKADRARKILEFMKKNGCNPNIFNYSALMNGLCKEGKLDEAREVFDEMKGAGLKPDKVTYTTLINFLCRVGDLEKATGLERQMMHLQKAKVLFCFVLLESCCFKVETSDALEILDSLHKHCVSLCVSQFQIGLNWLMKNRKLDKHVAIELLELHGGQSPNKCTSFPLLVRCFGLWFVDEKTNRLSVLTDTQVKRGQNKYGYLIARKKV
ncbi:hypothetical protein LguiB_015476 [Lonicera macranthoides]